MLFKRIYNVLRANINSGDNTKKFEYEFSESNSNYHQEHQKNVDPEKEKELKYLSNLELKEGASMGEIKQSYKRLMKRYHPDKFYGDEKKMKFAERVTVQLNEAYAYFEKKYEA